MNVSYINTISRDIEFRQYSIVQHYMNSNLTDDTYQKPYKLNKCTQTDAINNEISLSRYTYQTKKSMSYFKSSVQTFSTLSCSLFFRQSKQSKPIWTQSRSSESAIYQMQTLQWYKINTHIIFVTSNQTDNSIFLLERNEKHFHRPISKTRQCGF